MGPPTEMKTTTLHVKQFLPDGQRMDVTSHSKVGDKWLLHGLKIAQNNFGLGSGLSYPPQSQEVLSIRLVCRIVHTSAAFLGNFRS